MDFFEKAQARAHAQEVLGLAAHPDLEDIKAAYKQLAREKHPDRGDGTDDEFVRINAAYALLKEDKGFMAADTLRPAPTDTGATTFHPKARCPDNFPVSDIPNDCEDAAGTRVVPRRLRTETTSRIIKINQSEASECRTLLDEMRSMAEPEPDEKSLRASIIGVVNDTGAPHVPYANHLPYAIRQSGRRISYIVKEPIKKGVNRVAVPTGAFSDNRKVLPIIVRFKADEQGAGTHVAPAATLAGSFPGAKSVRVHFGLGEWPKPAAELEKGD